MSKKEIIKLKSATDNKFKPELMGNDVNALNEITSSNLFNSLDNQGNGSILKKDILLALESRGILMSDPRISDLVTKLKGFKDTESISPKQFHSIIIQNITLVEKALKGDLIIPDFESFTTKVKKIFDEIKSNKEGHVADYIPQLARVNPDQYAISICTIDGQQFHLGDYEVPYSIQSTSKPISYALALEEFGEEKVHSHIGREPVVEGLMS